MKSLTKLHLRENDLCSLQSLSNLSQLHEIDISYNSIDQWSEVSRLSKLKS